MKPSLSLWKIKTERMFHRLPAEGTGVFLGLLQNAMLRKGLIEIGFVSFLSRRKRELLDHVI